MGRPLDHADEAQQYAERVISGEIPACKWVKLACERQIRDLEEGPARGLRYDRVAANRICSFIELLPHIKGKWARSRQLITLEPWQKFRLCTVFGWMRRLEDGREVRRFRTSYTEVPRKNAKSTETSAVALYMLGPDEEEGAECVSAATSKDQASIVFTVARQMALRTPRYQERFGIEVLKHSLVREGAASYLKALSSDYDNLDGLNLHLAAVDELHAHKDRALWDVLETAMGARDQPLLWAITTAGSNQQGICYEQRDYTCKVLEGLLDDDAYFGIIYTVDDPEKWDDPEQWRIANPNLGVSVGLEYMEERARKARHSAPAHANFLTKHLDVWVNAASAWMNMPAWKDCADPDIKEPGIPPEFDRRPCWIGADLAGKADIASLSYVFPADDGTLDIFGRHYLPEDLVDEYTFSTGGHYRQWAKSEWLTLSPGSVLDFDQIEQQVREDAQKYEVLGFCHDPWQAHHMVQHLMEANIPCVQINQTVQNFSPAMKELDALVRAKRVRHQGDPCATWMVSNVTCKEDFKGNIFPRKEKPNKKIDFLVSLLNAMNRVVVHMEEPPSVYEKRGPLFLGG